MSFWGINSRAFDKGVLAGLSGVKQPSCPYPATWPSGAERSDERGWCRSWSAGFQVGLKEKPEKKSKVAPRANLALDIEVKCELCRAIANAKLGKRPPHPKCKACGCLVGKYHLEMSLNKDGYCSQCETWLRKRDCLQVGLKGKPVEKMYDYRDKEYNGQ